MCPLSLPQAYNIHVNGVLHCRVRYSQLLGLHEQVRLQPSQKIKNIAGSVRRPRRDWSAREGCRSPFQCRHVHPGLSLVFVPCGRYRRHKDLPSLRITTTAAWGLALLFLPESKLLHVNGQCCGRGWETRKECSWPFFHFTCLETHLNLKKKCCGKCCVAWIFLVSASSDSLHRRSYLFELLFGN